MSDDEFEECPSCRCKPGTPNLCELCLLRRAEHGMGFCGCYLLWDMDPNFIQSRDELNYMPTIDTDHHSRCGRKLGPLGHMRRTNTFRYDR